MERDQALPESCRGCGTTRELAFFLHNIRFRGNISRLCTNCLLKNNHGMFCPFCFDVYDPPPPPHLRLMCLKCPSIAHRSCVVDSSISDAPVSRFHCPSCADPKYSYFKLDRNNPSLNEATNADGVGDHVSVPAQKADGEGDPVSVSAQNADGEGDAVSVFIQNADGEGDSVSVSAENAQNSRAIDIEMAKALLAAARIAAFSLNKAVATARLNAERQCKEAALARKKAKEALERLSSIVAKELDAEDDSDST